jgi:hypothetical protein
MLDYLLTGAGSTVQLQVGPTAPVVDPSAPADPAGAGAATTVAPDAVTGDPNSGNG